MLKYKQFEEVFYYEYYDGPIYGVANWKGKPYFFQYQIYYESGKDLYYLSPITNETLELVVEAWKIWKRWDTAFHNGETNYETHPYLPSDRQRGEQLQNILDEYLKIDISNYIELDAVFKIKEDQENTLGMKNLIVKWQER